MVLLALAALLVGQVIEAPDMVRVLIAVPAGSGLYLLIIGAVARGLRLARRPPVVAPRPPSR